MINPAELQPYLGCAPQLSIVFEQLHRIFEALKSEALFSHFEVDATDSSDHNCTRGLIADSFCDLSCGCVGFKSSLVVTRLAIDVSDGNGCLSLDTEILRLSRQRQRFSEQPESLLRLAHVLVVVTEGNRTD